jgi:hypothetical protein
MNIKKKLVKELHGVFSSVNPSICVMKLEMCAYKLIIIIKFSHPFLYTAFTDTDFSYVKSVQI